MTAQQLFDRLFDEKAGREPIRFPLKYLLGVDRVQCQCGTRTGRQCRRRTSYGVVLPSRFAIAVCTGHYHAWRRGFRLVVRSRNESA